MNWFQLIVIDGIMLGIGLAMDAFSVSLTDGLSEPKMRLRKVFTIAGLFAFFQAIMPLIGWLAVTAFSSFFSVFEKYHIVSWIAIVLLAFIGGKMLYENLRKKDDNEEEIKKLTLGAILVQAVATSIDAMTAGFQLTSTYNEFIQYPYVLIAVGIIAVLTFGICFAGVKIGQKFGTKFSDKAGILGGCVLIFLALKILFIDILSII